MTNTTDVMLIGGGGRSGSTLLLRLLGTIPGYFPIGELIHIWEDGFLKNHLCGCGKPFLECEYWIAVVNEVFGGPQHAEPQRMIELMRATQRFYHIPLVEFSSLRPEAYERQITEYAAVNGSLYRAVQKVSGCDVVVDSTKRPVHAFTLSTTPGVRPRMLHLVRDSRAVAYSWQRKKRDIGVTGTTEYMYQQSSLRTSFNWTINNVFPSIVARRFAQYAVYRYEDLVVDPQRVFTEIALEMGVQDVASLPFVSDRAINFPINHTLWGNPNRFERGVVTIRPDMEWKEKMTTSKKFQVTALTLPWLLKYRYVGPQKEFRPAIAPA